MKEMLFISSSAEKLTWKTSLHTPKTGEKGSLLEFSDTWVFVFNKIFFLCCYKNLIFLFREFGEFNPTFPNIAFLFSYISIPALFFKKKG